MSEEDINDDGWQLVVPMSTGEDFHVQVQMPFHIAPNVENTSSTTTRRSIHNSASVSASTRNLDDKTQQLQRSQLHASIHATYTEILQESPDILEEQAIQRAMEMSLLDFAIVEHKGRHKDEKTNKQQPSRSPYEILGLSSKNATIHEIKAAYRQLAKLHHPDKGGNAAEFATIAKAYRSLLSTSMSSSSSSSSHHSIYKHDTTTHDFVVLKSTAHWDAELKSHRALVQDLFADQGGDKLQDSIEKQAAALELLSLIARDAGATNRNEDGRLIHNSCFYLSLAVSYLWGIGALSHTDAYRMEEDPALLFLLQDTALQLKRTIEAAVVKAHPEWLLAGHVGEDVQAFADFLLYSLESPSLLSEWAVVIFDTTSGYVDVYQGKYYNAKEGSQANTITLRYEPGHYQAFIPSTEQARRPTLQDILSALDSHGVFYVVTDGNA